MSRAGASTGLKGALVDRAFTQGVALAPYVFRVLRKVWPIPRFGSTVIVTRHDDVREVFLDDASFGVPYRAKLDVIMGGQPFFLGMGNDAEYRRQTAALRRMVRAADIPSLAVAVQTKAEAIVSEAGGEIEVVDGLVRPLAFAVFGAYFGIADTPGGNLEKWASRLFAFQFADPWNDPALRAEVGRIAPGLRAHVQGLIEERRRSGAPGDDVLGRCLVAQAAGDPDFTDDLIRTALVGLVVGGPPQAPMVVPQALEQLLRRPEAFSGAQAAARAGDDRLLARYVFEAMRFDPLGPALSRVALRDCILAEGTSRATRIEAGDTIITAFSSAMFDRRRIPDPRRFDPYRLPFEYMHFGYGLHTCFGLAMNHVLLPLMLKSLLQRDDLRRAPGRDGRLAKRGLFAERLVVRFSD